MTSQLFPAVQVLSALSAYFSAPENVHPRLDGHGHTDSHTLVPSTIGSGSKMNGVSNAISAGRTARQCPPRVILFLIISVASNSSSTTTLNSATHTHTFTYLLTYLLIYLLTYLLTYLLINVNE